MQCVYRIRVVGELKLLEKKPLNIRRFIYEFETDADGTVSHVRVTTSLQKKEEWPQFVSATSPGEAHTLIYKNPSEIFLRIDLQGLETALSILGRPKLTLTLLR